MFHSRIAQSHRANILDALRPAAMTNAKAFLIVGPAVFAAGLAW
jgi:hypothetical protein